MMMSVGSLKITQQAFIISIVGAIVGILIAMKGMVIPGLIVMFGAFLAAYNSNCTVVGHCNIWAWTLAIVYSLSLTMLVLGRRRI